MTDSPIALVLSIFLAGIVVGGLQAVRSSTLLAAALWLAGASVATSLALYTLGAAEIAVIELSVGAGLVPVLVVFAVNLTGDGDGAAPSIVPRALVWLLLGLVLITAVLLVAPAAGMTALPGTDLPLSTLLWKDRGLDVLPQLVVIFAGALGIVGLLTVRQRRP